MSGLLARESPDVFFDEVCKQDRERRDQNGKGPFHGDHRQDLGDKLHSADLPRWFKRWRISSRAAEEDLVLHQGL